MKDFKKVLVGVLLFISLFFISKIEVNASSKYELVKQKSFNTYESFDADEISSNGKSTVVGENGVSYTLEKTSGDWVVTITIPEDYEGLTIDLTPDMDGAFGISGLYIPGGVRYIDVRIVNNSKHNYEYQNNSLIVSTSDIEHIYDETVQGAKIADKANFDGTNTYTNFSLKRTSNSALLYLFYGTSVPNPNKIKSDYKYNDYFKDATIITELSEGVSINGVTKTYNSIDELDNYYVDYYNWKLNKTYTSIDEFTASEIASTIFGGYIINYQLFETNKELSSLSYDFFYNELLGVYFNDKAYSNEDSINNSIGAYMRRNSVYGDTNTYLKNNINLESDASANLSIGVGINGPLTTNPYQSYWFSFYFNMTLDRTDFEPAIEEKIEKTSDKEIITKDEEVTYIINYNAKTFESIGKGTVTIIDTLEAPATIISMPDVCTYDDNLTITCLYAYEGTNLEQDINISFAITLKYLSLNVDKVNNIVNGYFTIGNYVSDGVEDNVIVNLKKGNVVAHYVDDEGNTLSDDVTSSDLVGNDYETQAKDIEDYELIDIIGSEKGLYEEKDIEVTYVYQYVMGEGKEEIEPPKTGLNENINVASILMVTTLSSLVITKKKKETN